MKELAKRFIDKECVISSFDGNHQYEGIIKEVTDEEGIAQAEARYAREKAKINNKENKE